MMTAPLISTPAPDEQIRAWGCPDYFTDEEAAGWAMMQREVDALVAVPALPAAFTQAPDAPASPAPATITRHDWFAGQALAGICAGYFASEAMTGTPPSAITDFARECADAMVEALK